MAKKWIKIKTLNIMKDPMCAWVWGSVCECKENQSCLIVPYTYIFTWYFIMHDMEKIIIKKKRL